MNPKWLEADIKDIDNVSFTKRTADIEINNKHYRMLLPVNSIIELSNLLKK
ncbi:hypothetical protein MUB42_05540 [Apilactobacillus kunkeei]|nr:hypothetical protein MUB42_05540 [Apilactobacillus kunkeei]